MEKKKNNTYFCIYYQWLNSITKKDTYHILCIDSILNKLQEVTILLSIDLTSGFWQVPLSNAAKEKISFIYSQSLF